jgi:hypothetical protein
LTAAMGIVFFFTGIMIFFDFKASRSKTDWQRLTGYCNFILFCNGVLCFCGKISRTTTSDVGSFVSLDFSKSSLLPFFFRDSIF